MQWDALWPDGLESIFTVQVLDLDPEKLFQPNVLQQKLKGAHILVLDDITKLDDRPLAALMSFITLSRDDARPMGEGEKFVRPRDWIGAMTGQRKGLVPDQGGGSFRRFNACYVEGTIPQNPEASGMKLRSALLGGLNMRLWHAARARLTWPNGRPVLDRGYRPIDDEGASITREELDSLRGDAVPFVLSRTEHWLTAERRRRNRKLSQHAEAYERDDPVETYLSEREVVHSVEAGHGAAFTWVHTQTLLNVSQGLSAQRIRVIAEGRGWQWHRRLPSNVDPNRRPGFTFIRKPAESDSR